MDNLKQLRNFLSQSFRGATVGALKIDDCVKSLDEIIDERNRLRVALTDILAATGEGPRRDAAIAAAQKILDRK